MSVISDDVWSAVLPFCGTTALLTLRAVNKRFWGECERDRYWAARLRVVGLTGREALLRPVYAAYGFMETLRRCAVAQPQAVDLSLVHHTAVEWSHNYRCEHMLTAEKGTFCTAPGVTNATVTCRADTPFLLTKIRAKGGGRGFTSPLKRFSLTLVTQDGSLRAPEFELPDPSAEHVFCFDPPVLAHTADIHLLEGAQQDDNIDTDYIVLHGKPLPM